MQLNHRIAVINSVVLLATVLSGAIAILTLLISSPRSVGPFGVTLWFLISFVFLGGLISLISYKHQKKKIENKAYLGRIYKSSLRSGFLISALLIILLALRSVHLLTIGDAVLLILAVCITELFFRTKAQ